LQQAATSPRCHFALARSQEASLKIGEQGHIPLRSEPADITDAKCAVLSAATLRRVYSNTDALRYPASLKMIWDPGLPP
jgi:hypothetical protein